MGTLSALDSLRTGGHVIHSKGACTLSALDSLRKANQRRPTENRKQTNRASSVEVSEFCRGPWARFLRWTRYEKPTQRRQTETESQRTE